MATECFKDSALAPPKLPALLVTLRDGVPVAKGSPAFTHGTRHERSGQSSDGVFAEWSWDGRRLHAAVDRLGFHPLYVYSKGADVGVSTSLPALIELGADGELDHAAVAVALRLGQFIGDDTPFRYIRTLPPNGVLGWSDGQATVTGACEIFTSPLAISRDEATERYIETFKAAVARRSPGDCRFAVPLSGGRDSRHILFELVRSGHTPACCLTYKTDQEDVRVAREICTRLKVRHVMVENGPDAFALEVQKNWIANFGHNKGEHPLPMARALGEEGITTIYDGLAGDVLSAGLFLTDERLDHFASGRLQAFAEELLRGPEWMIKKLLSPSLYRECSREAALGRLVTELRKHETAHNPVTSYFFWNRTRRKIAQFPFALLSTIPTVHAPFLDHEVFDFLMGLPARLVLDHSLHTDVIHRAYPDLADILFAAKGGQPFERHTSDARFARRYARVALLRHVPAQLNAASLRARLGASLLSRGTAANLFGYLRRALWIHQLASLGDAR